MRASVVLTRTGCGLAAFKMWVRAGVIIPVAQTSGRGLFSEYDDANLIAVALAMELTKLGMVPTRLARSFSLLQSTLRSRSSTEWKGARIVLTSERLSFEDAANSSEIHAVAVVVDLDRLAARIAPLNSPDSDENESIEPNNPWPNPKRRANSR
jgi:hypothetical protein